MEKKPNEKKVLVLSFLGVLTFIAVVVGATYAYFTAQGGGTGNIDVNATTNTTDNLSFQVGEAISLTANQEDFGQGADNKSGSTFARATLTANNATNNATRNYYVYLDITSYDFEYTTEDSQGEILLKVTDPEGTEVTSLPGLIRKTSGGVTGFDITTSTGLITIADNYEIVSTGTVTQEWQIEVIFVNLDSDQNANTGKTFNANLIIQEEPMEDEELAYHETCTPGTMACDIARTYNETNPETNGLYYHDGQGTYVNADQEAEDNSYRYSGANPDNYVCFGSDEETCPADNLYRIIGVFDGEVKLIKSDYAGESVLGTAPARNDQISNYPNYKGSLSSIPCYYWSGSSSNNSNIWSSSTLNSSVLNGTYVNSLESEWNELIENHTWQVGGTAYENVLNNPVQTAYNYEVGTNAENTTYNAKIGLMYASDYGYAVSPENWSSNMGSINTYRNNNWMYMGADEWTISRAWDLPGRALIVTYGGYMFVNNVGNEDYVVRPSFYLESSVVLESGDGTQENPFRISAGV